MEIKRQYFFFAGDVCLETEQIVIPLFIRVDSKDGMCSLADAAEYLIKEAQNDKRVVIWLAPVEKEDEETFRNILSQAVKEKRHASAFDLFNMDISDCIYINPSFFCGTAEKCAKDSQRMACDASGMARLIWASELNSCHKFISSQGNFFGISQYCPGRNDVLEVQFGPLPKENVSLSNTNKFFRIPASAIYDSSEGEIVMQQLSEFIRNEYGDNLTIF